MSVVVYARKGSGYMEGKCTGEIRSKESRV